MVKKYLVCGGRDFNDYARMEEVLDKIIGNNPFWLVHGAARGADKLSGEYARTRDCKGVFEYPADWDTHGKAAGHIRNKEMLLNERPDLVIAFPGGVGTANMISLAKKHNYEVLEVPNIDIRKP